MDFNSWFISAVSVVKHQNIRHYIIPNIYAFPNALTNDVLFWSFTLREAHILSVFEKRVLRKMFGLIGTK